MEAHQMNDQQYTLPFSSPNAARPGLTRRDDAAPSEKEIRSKAAKKAFDAADRIFIERYEMILREIAASGQEFTGETVTARYVALHGQPREKRAVGYLFTKLQVTGVIEEVGSAKRANGNKTAVYRGKNQKGEI
jgi:hypothetical protein